MIFYINKIVFEILRNIINKLKLYKLVYFSKIYNNGWWIKRDIKVMILGSSFAKSNIIPKVISKLYPKYRNEEIVNLGQSMGAPFEMYISLIKIKKYIKNLEYAYIGIDPHILGEKFYHYMLVEKQFVTYEQWNYLFNKNGKYMDAYHSNLKVSSFSPIIFFKDFFIKKYRKSEQYFGYEPRRIGKIKKFNKEKIKEYTYGDLKKFPISKFSIKYLKRIQTFIEKNTNAKIIYFLSPSYDWHLGYEEYCKEYDNQLINLLNDNLGQICIKGSLDKDSFELNQFDFSDNRHLNHLGAIKYTRVIFSELENVEKQEIYPLYSYKDKYKISNNINLLNGDLEILNKEIQKFILDKESIILYGFNNVSRIITSLIPNNIEIIICDSSSFLGSLPSFLEDNFIKKKKIIHINKFNFNINNSGIIVTNLSSYEKEVSFLKNLNLSTSKIFKIKPEIIDCEYLHLQINILFNLFDYIYNNFDYITIVGNSILKSFIIERFREKEITTVDDLLFMQNVVNKDSIYIILNNFNFNKDMLVYKFNINLENVVYIDL
ncbi:hypothetical protein [Aliarcobacter butzleri]|uniref:hypothetical protein n=1 Tax=Aliarcobacter butzleri TaxID=28197 RepID=UPI003B226526